MHLDYPLLNAVVMYIYPYLAIACNALHDIVYIATCTIAFILPYTFYKFLMIFVAIARHVNQV